MVRKHLKKKKKNHCCGTAVVYSWKCSDRKVRDDSKLRARCPLAAKSRKEFLFMVSVQLCGCNCSLNNTCNCKGIFIFLLRKTYTAQQNTLKLSWEKEAFSFDNSPSANIMLAINSDIFGNFLSYIRINKISQNKN